MNNLYRQLMGSQNSLPTNIQQMVKMFKGASNPQQLIQNLAKQNPQVQQVMNMIQNSGKSPKDLFYEMANQRGINPEEILKQLK